MSKYPQEVINELLARSEKEQALRLLWDKDDTEELRLQVKEVDEDNTKFLKEVVKKYGWPKISQVGEEAANGAWLLAQHTADTSFLKQCLGLMQSQPNEVEPQNLARTIDRVRIDEGKLQLYGTHFTQNPDGKWVPLPIEDETHVEQRRSTMKLPTLAQKTKEYNN